MRTVGQTDRQDMNLIVAFRNFWKPPPQKKKTKLSTKERIECKTRFFLYTWCPEPKCVGYWTHPLRMTRRMRSNSS